MTMTRYSTKHSNSAEWTWMSGVSSVCNGLIMQSGLQGYDTAMPTRAHPCPPLPIYVISVPAFALSTMSFRVFWIASKHPSCTSRRPFRFSRMMVHRTQRMLHAHARPSPGQERFQHSGQERFLVVKPEKSFKINELRKKSSPGVVEKPPLSIQLYKIRFLKCRCRTTLYTLYLSFHYSISTFSTNLTT